MKPSITIPSQHAAARTRHLTVHSQHLDARAEIVSITPPGTPFQQFERLERHALAPLGAPIITDSIDGPSFTGEDYCGIA